MILFCAQSAKADRYGRNGHDHSQQNDSLLYPEGRVNPFPIEMQKRTLAFALIAAGVLAWLAWHFWATRFDAPVAFEGVQNVGVDAAPVDVVLHEYVRGSDTTTGRSIVFRFPKSYYAWAENARGGPQYRVQLSVAADTFEPIGVLDDAIRKDGGLTPDQRKLKIRQVWGSDLSIRVYSPTKSISAVTGAASAYQAYKEGAAHPLGSICDWAVFARKSGALLAPDELPAGLTPETAIQDAGQGLLALSDEASSVGSLAAATCVGHSPICVVQVPYRDWMMSFHVQRSELCEWQAVAAKTATFLDAHVVGSSERRQ
jgi:hypothetical protein